MQTKLESFIEALINTIIGFGVNFFANLVILPLYGFTELTASSNFQLGILYTGISISRSYILRRYFNGKIKNISHTTAGVLQ